MEKIKFCIVKSIAKHRSMIKIFVGFLIPFIGKQTYVGMAQEKNNFSGNIVNKSNNVKLLVVETPTNNLKLVDDKQSNEMNFRLINYFAKRNIKYGMNIVLNNCLAGQRSYRKIVLPIENTYDKKINLGG